MLENVELSGATYRRKVDALLTAGAANIGCSKYSVALGHLGKSKTVIFDLDSLLSVRP